MKKSILLLLLGITISFSGVHAQDWLDFRAESCLCKAQFPASPELKQEQKEGYKSNQAVAEYEGDVFLLDYSTFPEPMDKEDGIIFAREAVNAFSETLGAMVIKEKKYKMNGWEGLATQMEIPGEEAIIYYNTVLVRSINYQIVMIGSSEDAKKRGKKFIKSFKLQ